MHSSRRSFLALSAGLAGLTLAGCRREAGSTAPAATGPASILILGGTGFLGPHVVEAARARGVTIALFNRGKTNPHLFPEVEKFRGDRDGQLGELAAAVQAGRRWTAVVDTSGYVPRHVRDSAKLLAPAIDHYIFISSISVYADPSKRGLSEADAVGRLDDPSVETIGETTYGPLKALCEEAASAAMPGRVTNVRPGLIVGPGDPSDRFTYWPARAARGGRMIAPGRPADPVQVIDARDLAAWLVECVLARHFGTFNATGPAQGMTVGAMVDACVQAGGAGATPVWIPAEFLAAQEVSPWSDMPVWVPPDGEAGGMGAVDVRRALAAGLVFRPIAETARDTLVDWQGLPEERRAKPRAGLSAEREAAVLAAWDAAAKAKAA